MYVYICMLQNVQRKGSTILNDVHYRVHTVPKHVMVSIPCALVETAPGITTSSLPSGPVLSNLHHPSTDYALDPSHPGLMMRNYTVQVEGKYLILMHLSEAPFVVANMKDKNAMRNPQANPLQSSRM